MISAKPQGAPPYSAARVQATLKRARREDLHAYSRAIHPLVTPGAPFEEAYHFRAITWALTRLLRGDIRRLAIAVPPRWFKSFAASVALPTWALGHEPGLQIICASYGTDLAKGFGVQSRDVMGSQLYQSLFTTRLDRFNAGWDNLATTAKGYRRATSVGGVLTGKGADLVIIDDPMKAISAESSTERETVHAWFTGSVMSRFDHPLDGRVAVVMQRLHNDDLIGRVLKQEGWEYLALPAEAPKRLEIPLSANKIWEIEPGALLFEKRFGSQALAQLKRDLGEAAYNAQVLQTPSPPGGAMIKLKWFGRYDVLPPRSQIEAYYQAWDTAFSESDGADYSAGITIAVSGKRLYVVDMLRRRMPFHDLEKTVIGWQDRYKAKAVMIEEAGSGISLMQNIRQLRGHRWLVSIPAKGDKISRAARQIPKLERRRVLLPNKAGWLAAFESEIAAFPYDRHDDQVDALVHMLTIFDYGTSEFVRDLSMFAGWGPGEPPL